MDLPEKPSKKKETLTLGGIFNKLVSCGHSIQDLKYNYTIDQVYLFYEKCEKEEMNRDKMEAIVLSECMYYTSPSYSQQDVSRKKQSWTRFMKSLSWEDTIEKKKDPLKMFVDAGIPIMDMDQMFPRGGK